MKKTKKYLLFISVIAIMCISACMSVGALGASGQCGENAFYTYNEATGELVISGEGVICHNSYSECFDGWEIRKVTIEEGITGIGHFAFRETDISEIVIPDSVKSLGLGVFMQCKSLEKVILPENMTEIPSLLFAYCYSLEEVNIPKKIESIGESAFGACVSLEEIALPDGLKVIESSTFAQCLFSQIDLPDTLEYIGSGAFSYCVNLSEVKIPESVKIIDQAAFGGCYSLETFEIPTAVEWVGDNCFAECPGLESITIKSEKSQYGEAICGVNGFEFTDKEKAVFYIAEALKEYAKENWEKFEEYLEKAYEYIIEYDTPKYPTFYCHDDDKTYSIEAYAAENGIELVKRHFFGEWYTDENNNEVARCTLCDATHKKSEHTYTEKIIKPATHFVEGEAEYTCSVCFDSYKKAVKKTDEHAYTVHKTVSPDCENKGYTTYVCPCGSTYNGDYVSAKGHNYDGDICTVCGESKIENCKCNCHKGGFSGFIYKILRFFWKLFKINRECACGALHY